MKRLLDVDQLLIFALLAVTVNQMGHYLAGFAPPGLRWIGYCQAVAIDAAIWRSAYWHRRYGGRKQRHWSLAGVVLFSLVSAWYNRNYYAAAAPSLGAVAPWLMGAVLPGGVALLSYLLGQKDESRFATTEQRHSDPLPESQPVTGIITECDSGKMATTPYTLASFQATYPRLLEMTGRQIAELAGVSERTGNNWKRIARMRGDPI